MEYLISFHEYKYNLLIHSFDKCMESYYQKGCAKEVKIIHELSQAFLRRNHVKLTYRHNAYHSNTSLTRAE